ncbi:MAG: inorganic pyrophosphatase [Candidatus Tyloplasma litorale]|nr:MAG: inorganic pyrophosphatase [Mycoplasmatales bacterium]
MKINAIIEIPKNSNIKYEIEDGKLKIDRILFGSMRYPLNYGFFENTLDWDGDPLDVLILADQSFLPSSIVPIRVIGAMKMIDGGETDTKIIGVIDVDPRYNHIKNMGDIPEHMFKEMKDFFENYKNLQNKKCRIEGFEGKEYAISEYNKSLELFNKYGKMDKDKFIEKMKIENPEKYD